MEKQMQAGGITKSLQYFKGLYTLYGAGYIYSHKSNKILKLSVDINGYNRVTLTKNKEQWKVGVHRLVAMAFIPNPENKPHVNHKDGNKLNNHPSNLEWCTPLENNIHAYQTGLKVLPKGKDDKRSVPIVQYDLNGNFVREWAGAREAQRLGGFRQSNIWHCLQGNQHKSQGFIWKYK